MTHVKEDLGFGINRMKAWRAKMLAMRRVDGDEKDQYGKLQSYGLEIMKTNPGSTVKLWLDFGVFKGIYVCLAPLKNAFKSRCRPLISVDGCWLKGQLLSAVAIDPNDCIFPLAYAVVQVENRETWTWFLDLLGQDLEIQNSHHMAFMSDRQKVFFLVLLLASNAYYWLNGLLLNFCSIFLVVGSCWSY